MKAKEYQIKTVQDMIDCTNEANLENFLTDLKLLLKSSHEIRSMAELIGELKGLPKDMQEVKSEGFTWIDDGKHDYEITIGKN